MGSIVSTYMNYVSYFNVYNSSPVLQMKTFDYRKVNKFAESHQLVNRGVRSKLWKHSFRDITKAHPAILQKPLLS